MSFVDVFSGGVIQPAEISYTNLTLTSATTQLQWPSLAQDGDSVLARITEMSASSGTPVVKLPDATLVSTGQDTLLRNTGSITIAVQKNDGSALLSLASGEVKYAYLTDASTAAGSWTVVAFGASVGSLDASQLAGFGLKAIASTLNTAHPVTSTTVGFTIQNSDRARVYQFTGGAVTLALQTASTYGDNFFFGLANTGSGAVTLDPAGTETIDGASTIDINPGESAFVVTNGSTWITVGRGRSVNFNFTQLVKDVSGSSDVTLTTTEAGNPVFKFIGTLTGNINVIVPNVVGLYIVDNETSGAFTLTLKTAAGTGVSVPQANRNILYSDGTNVLNAVTVSVSFTSFSDGSAASPSITFTSDTNTGFYRAAENTVGIAAGGVSRMTISDTAIVSDFLDRNAIAWAMAMS